MKRIIISLLAAIVVASRVVFAFAAPVKRGDYISPMKIPLLLSSNFGELRPNHFHSGLDIKTQGVTGLDVVAVADGYISRIFVSPYGYGRALYVTHPIQGTVSVYGHLESFAPEIERWVLQNQYNHKSFAVNLFPSAVLFPVKKGELIAFSGNSGASGGPHLHFEIREGASQSPVNLLSRKIYDIADNKAPNLINLYVIAVDSSAQVPCMTVTDTYKLALTSKGYVPITSGRTAQEVDTIKISKSSYFGISYVDLKVGVPNVFGISGVTLSRSGKTIFSYDIDNFTFEQSRYINALTYPATIGGKSDAITTFVTPNNKLPIYNKVVNKGIISLQSIKKEGEPIEIIVSDDSGGDSKLTFILASGGEAKTTSVPKGIPVPWNSNISKSGDSFSVLIPKGALYESTFIEIDKTNSSGAFPVVKVGNMGVRLQKPITVSIKPGDNNSVARSKMVVTRLVGSTQIYVGGKYSSGAVTAESSNLGTFTVAIDTIPPVIKFNFDANKSITGGKIVVEITDNLSGVKSYNGYLNGKWVLFDYDAKNNLLKADISSIPFDYGTRPELKIVVTDSCGNAATIKDNIILPVKKV